MDADLLLRLKRRRRVAASILAETLEERERQRQTLLAQLQQEWPDSPAWGDEPPAPEPVHRERLTAAEFLLAPAHEKRN